MSDPRNVAHDKKVHQEKEHHKPASGSGAIAGDDKEAAETKPAAAEIAKAEAIWGFIW
jgi:hypothetical protein